MFDGDSVWCLGEPPTELTVVQQSMTQVTEGYGTLGELLRAREADLSRRLGDMKEAREQGGAMKTWLADMKKKAAASCNAAGASGKDSVKAQMEQQKVQTQYRLIYRHIGSSVHTPNSNAHPHRTSSVNQPYCTDSLYEPTTHKHATDQMVLAMNALCRWS